MAGLALTQIPVATGVSSAAKQDFISSLVSPAQQAQRLYGVPASVTIAQAIVNTDFGTSTLAKKARNYFGTRCTSKMTAAQFAKLAEAQVGKAYVLGASAAISNPDPKRFDCSELVKWLFGRSGNPITDLAAAQYSATKSVSAKSPKVGDLVFLRNNPARSNGIGHVAVLTKKLKSGDWEIIEARGHAYGVVKTTLSYWKKRKYYAGLRRYSKLHFAGQEGVLLSSTTNAYQAGCLTVTSGKKKVTYRKYQNKTAAVLDHATMINTSSAYAAVRKQVNNRRAFIAAIARVEHPSSAVSYAAAVLAAVNTYNLAKYDVAPLTITLSSGKTGAKVTALQLLLQANGISGVKVNGTYNANTAKAVKKLQSKKKLTVSGKAGAATLLAAFRTAKSGNHGGTVKALQTLLAAAGYSWDASAKFGTNTLASVKAFQSNTGISVTGKADVNTWAKLFMQLETAPSPKLSGTAVVGKTIKATAGTWGPGSVSVAYQWYRGSTAISGATGASYTLRPADAGQKMKITTTGSKPAYTSLTRSAVSGVIKRAKLTATPTPHVSGKAVVASTLTAVTGTWAPATVTLKYQWYRGSTAISGATAARYTVRPADVGSRIKVVVTGVKSGYYSVARTSPVTALTTKASLTAAPNPTISGKRVVGQTLTAVPGKWLPAPVTLSYQWYRGSAAIKNATSVHYRLTKADKGKKITLKVTGRKPGYQVITRSVSFRAS